MTRIDDLIRENEVLRDRLSKLSEASLSINETLDFEMVLQGVLDTARSLTNARYGVITSVDKEGLAEEFLTSGMTAEERQWLAIAPGRKLFFEYFKGLSDTVRVHDVPSHLESIGISEPCPLATSSFLATPIRHQGERIGYIHLAEKTPGEQFTLEDEDTLEMFAWQAGMVIANARMYREEKRARADLETLIETSPVGVVVFKARKKKVVSINQEALRMFELLKDPEDCTERLLERLTVRRGDGTETALPEFFSAWMLDSGETMRSEEILFRVHDGRSVTALVNATPILLEDGNIESVVVTLQDMTPMEDLERLRAEFLAMVSHELRTPLTSIKGSVTTLVDPSSPLNQAEVLQFHQIIDAQTDRMRELIADLLDVAHIETGTLRVSPEPTDLAAVVDEARNTFLSGGGGNLHVDLAQGLPLVLADRPRIVQVLNNLLSNAARHSRESSVIQVITVREGLYVKVSVFDEGSGVSAERLPHLFKKFSVIESEYNGHDPMRSGLGLAICKGIVEAHGGRIWVESDGPDQGARFTFTIPVVEGASNGAGSAYLPSLEEGDNVRLRVLAVDDDPHALRYIRDTLSKFGYEPIVTSNPEEVLRSVVKYRPHLVLLDLVMPGIDGIELMMRIQETCDVPVIFLSAYGQDHIIARAFDMGAVDYVIKPFSPTELRARIIAALRKKDTPEPLEPFLLGDLAIDYSKREVTLAGHPLQLTPIEYRILAELSVNAGRALTYRHLQHRVWGSGNAGDIRPMRTAISGLRRKLGDDADTPMYIFTEPRIGYRMLGAVQSERVTQ